MAALPALTQSIDLGALHAVLFEGEAQENGWLAGCIIDQSPTTQTLVIASEHRFAVLQASATTKLYEVIGRGQEFHLPLSEKSSELALERINSVRCVEYPRSNQKGNGTAVVVGYSTGYVRIFTEGGRMLVAQVLHDGPIIRLRGQPASGCEDLAVLYPQVLVVMDGFGLLQTIRACVARLSRGFDLDADDCPPLSLKKWGLAAQKQSDDVVCFGATVPSAYENLLLNQTSSSPIHRYIVCGARPMITAYSTSGCEQSYFSAKALASDVAAKLGTAMLSVVSSFWGSGNNDPRKAQKSPTGATTTIGAQGGAVNERATSLRYEYELDDPRRQMLSMEVAPNDSAILITDTFGRVILFDVQTGTMVWIWKGYRDAQCGWLVVEESDGAPSSDHGDSEAPPFSDDEASSQPRSCALVVIYAPQRGLLEIWAPWFGHRVAAFNVGLQCQLLVQTAPRFVSSVSGFRKGGGCALIMPDGSFRRISVPFDAALSHASSAGLRDMQRIRKLRSMFNSFRNPGGDRGYPESELSSELTNLIEQIQSASGLQRCLDLTREIRLPESLGALVLVTLRTAFDAFMAARTDKASSKTENAQRFQNDLEAREGQVLTHRALGTFATNPLQLLVAPESCAQRTVSLPAIIKTKDSGAMDLNALLLYWSRKFPDSSCSAVPVHMPIDNFLWTIDQEAAGESHGVADEEHIRLSKFTFQSIVSGCCSVEKLLAELRLTRRSRNRLLYAFVEWGCSLPLWCLLLNSVHDTATAVLRALSRESFGDVENGASGWEEAYLSACEEMDSPAHALVLCVMGRSVAGSEVRAHAEWDTAVLRHVDLVCISLILSTGHSRAPTLATLRIPGRLLSVIVNHFVGLNCSFDNIIEARSYSHVTTILSQSDIDVQITPGQQMALLAHQMPKTFSLTSVALRCASRYVEVWVESQELVPKLRAAVGLLRECDPYLANAAASLLWVERFKAPFGILYDLIEKIGKAPKGRLCEKHLGWDGQTTTAFAGAAVDLIELLAHSTQILPDGSPDPELLRLDGRWESPSETDVLFGGTVPLDLPPHGITLNRRVLLQHLILARVLFAIVAFQLRATRPSALFLSQHRALLFAPFIGEHPESDEEPVQRDADRVYEDPTEAAAAAAAAEVRSARRQFMLKVVDEVVRRESEPEEFSQNVSQDVADVGRVFELAAQLGLDRDDNVRRQHIVALLTYGRDTEADDFLPAIVDTDALASQLLEVAIRQLAVLLNPELSPDANTLIGQLPPAVYEWCQAAQFVPAGSRAAMASPRVTTVARVLQLLERVLSMVPQGSSDRTRAERLSTALRKACE